MNKRLKFSTKAENLEQLSNGLQGASVLKVFYFTVEKWRNNPEDILQDTFIKKCICENNNFIVRSSAVGEDGEGSSLAGKYTSILNITGIEGLKKAIDTVVASYGSDCSSNDQVLIQPMLQNVILSGVAFSRDPNNSAACYVINYDDCSGSTETITSGNTNNIKTIYHSRLCEEYRYEWLLKVIQLLKELEIKFNCNTIDVEFAVTNQDKLFLLQVRPLFMSYKNGLCDDKYFSNLHKIRDKFKELSKKHPFLLGDESMYGVMPDWNPAEIIGIRPRPLSLSLYKELVTDSIWAYQRDNYGYRNLRSFPLLVSFYGLPYIDVRVSFNSFIPKSLGETLANKLVNFYLDRLKNNPEFHDKVEFDIVFSCYTLDLSSRMSILQDAGFSNHECEEICDALRDLTNNMIKSDGLWTQDLQKIEQLTIHIESIMASNLTKVEKIYWLLEYSKRYGTLPFAGLARAAFIAVQLLRSLVSVDIFSEDNYHDFFGSLHTVSADLKYDFSSLDKHNFLKKYGHLRPGTYDILSDRYDKSPEKYFSWDSRSDTASASRKFSLDLAQINEINACLKKHKISHDVVSLFNFIKSAIEGREHAKFVFTKGLSEAMKLFGEYGADLGFSLEDLSYADISLIKRLYSTTTIDADLLAADIACGRRAHKLTKSINLPSLITKALDIYSFELGNNEPNFITDSNVTAEVVFENSEHAKLVGNIVMIPSADPGYDWIFSHNIGGLITKYGGVNSHMAIRAAELNIPAVIGIGESKYDLLTTSQSLYINAVNKTIQVIK